MIPIFEEPLAKYAKSHKKKSDSSLGVFSILTAITHLNMIILFQNKLIQIKLLNQKTVSPWQIKRMLSFLISLWKVLFNSALVNTKWLTLIKLSQLS